LSYTYPIRREPYYYEQVEDSDEEPVEFTLLECIAATKSNTDLESDELYNKYMKIKID